MKNKNNMPKTSDLFNKLSDKDMLNELKFYDHLCLKFFNLRNKLTKIKNNYKDYFLEKDISYLLIKSETIYNLLEKELKNIRTIYETTNYRNFIRQTQIFKDLLTALDNTLSELDFLVLQLQKNHSINKQKHR